MVFDSFDHHTNPVIVGYAYLKGTPFILMVIKQKRELMASWQHTGYKLLIFLIGSSLAIVAVVVAMSTLLVNSIYQADQKRMASLHQVEYANKMASIGRLSAGVAHEINNPLAIINEKAGLIKDLFTFRNEYAGDDRLLGLVDSIISSVERCATITRQLLNFARNLQISLQKVSLRQIVSDVLEFQTKEAGYRSITIAVDIAEDIPEFVSDRGKLQQVFVNLVNNAFAAMKDGGMLRIVSYLSEDRARVITAVSDNGCGRPPERKVGQGLGLGLRIMRYRAEMVGGEFSISDAPGGGTRISSRIPCPTSCSPPQT